MTEKMVNPSTDRDMIMGGNPSRGKAAFIKSLEELINPRCTKCDARLPKYRCYSESYRFYKCDRCGYVNRKKR